MYTECPKCHAIFRVTQEILQAAGGKVRCGECATVFQAVKPQKEEVSAEENSILPSEKLAQKQKSKATKNSSVKVDRRGAPPEQPTAAISSFHRNDTSTEPATADLGDGAISSTAEDFVPKYLPVPATPERLPIRPRRSWAIPILMVLGLVLVMQLIVANRAYLGSKPLMRPVVTAVCKVSGCTVPVHKDLAAIELLNHGVFSHPTVPGALMIKGLILSNAKFEQPYPVIELGFSDIRGRPVAMRRFGPNEYLDLREHHPDKMPIGKKVPIRVEVIDPGKQALAFEFDFL